MNRCLNIACELRCAGRPIVGTRQIALLLMLTSSAAALSADESISFNRDVKPILAQNCFTCHGPDEHKRQGQLRLDDPAGAIRPAESGRSAIVPGQPDHSELLARVLSDDAGTRMPPAETGKQLTAREIDILRQWIAQGAAYQRHWAFETPVRPAVPAEMANFGPVSTNPIDQFVRQRLQQAGLKPSPPASRETLIRRASLDLRGLPPSPAEIDEFLADTSPEAWEHLVDRLLSSPEYGERMAISWLDHARYADSNGYQSDGSRDIWAWRDWVIRAYNSNMPYDQFTVEQLAGDMLPEATQDQIIATGFNRNHRLNGEGGRIEAEWFVETVIDRVETTGLTWLGLTLNCCRCHDHKYDPVSQREFYQLFAFFNSVEESGVLAPAGKNGENTPPLLTLSSAATEARIAELQQQVSAARSRLQDAERQIPELARVWSPVESPDSDSDSSWVMPTSTHATSKGGATLQRQDDNSWLASGKNPANDTYEIEVHPSEGQLTGLLLETLPDPSLPGQSLGRATNGNFVLTDVLAEITAPSLKRPRPVRFTKISADYEQPGWPAASVLTNARGAKNAGARKGWAIDGNDPQKRLPRRIMFVVDKPVSVPAGATLQVRLVHASQFADHNIGRFRLQVSAAEPAVLNLKSAGLPTDVRDILKQPVSARSSELQLVLQNYFRKHVANPALEAEQAVADAERRLTEYRDNLPTTMVMKEAQPRDAWILARGQYDQPTEKVGRGIPAFLPPLPDGAPLDRLGLARWIVHRSNPLTARVWVNREWERFFGTGLVRTTENLGSQAEFPSHPELLDWLACEFMEPTVAPAVQGVPARPWDMKALQKLILMSATWQQSSAVSPELLKQDPENRLLARASRFRLPAELVRDQALEVSGLLVHQTGGPSVRPYMPEGVWDETSKYGNLRGYKHDTGSGLYRRTLYTIWKRTAAPPTMLLFDAPNREVCTIKRSRTNTPLQALALLNEVTFVEAARALATRMVREGGSAPSDRISFGFRLLTGRRPTEKEQQILAAGYQQDHERFVQHPEAAGQLIELGDSPTPAEIAPAELAAWTMTANVLLNLDEFVTRE